MIDIEQAKIEKQKIGNWIQADKGTKRQRKKEYYRHRDEEFKYRTKRLTAEYRRTGDEQV